MRKTIQIIIIILESILFVLNLSFELNSHQQAAFHHFLRLKRIFFSGIKNVKNKNIIFLMKE